MTDCKKVFLDTAPIIYFLDDDMNYGRKVKGIFVDIAKRTAQIRAEYKGFKAMDALQLAAAYEKGCDVFLTNDNQLKQFQGMRCVLIDEW